MKHKWVKKPPPEYGKEYECKTCGLIKIEITHKMKFFFKKIATYIRSGQNFNNCPDCIDWDEENLKTID